MKKRIVSFILVALLVAGLLATAVFAGAAETYVDGQKYSIIVSGENRTVIYHAAKAATCTATGNKEYFKDNESDRCYVRGVDGFEHELHWPNIEIAINPDAHKAQTYPHIKYKVEGGDATCQHGTEYYQSCKYCGEALESLSTFFGTDKAEHKARTYPYKDYLKSEKTCQSYAVYYMSCKECGEALTETFDYVAGGYGAHTLVKVEAKEATYTAAGNNEYWACSTCGKAFKDAEGKTETTVADETIPVKTHTLVKVSYVAPTYKATGVKEHYKCSVCGALFWDKDGKKAITNANDVVIPKLVDYYYGAALYFNTNGGSSISAIYTTTTKTVDLTKYIPTRRGYTFAGWYADAKLTTPITSITLYPNGYRYNTYNSYTVYAGWYDDTWCSACSFWDVDYYDWYHDEVRYVVDNGIMEGISSRYFAPEEDMTRADLVVAMYRIAGSPSTKYTGVFTDVKSTADYALAVEWAAKYGIVNGVGNKKFDPNSAVTREQMAAIFYRFANYVDKYGYTPYRTTGFLWNYGKLSFKDSAKISAYAKDAVAWSAKNGIFYGDNSNRFNPQSNTTRAECAAILYRFCK